MPNWLFLKHRKNTDTKNGPTLWGKKRTLFNFLKKKTDLFKDYDIETSPKADKDEIFARIKLCTN